MNIPYDASHEGLLIALTAALISAGRIPRLTFQVPDYGEGRLRRIFSLLQSCRLSIHEMSAIGCPVRFNMPFELGMACAMKHADGHHDFLIFDEEPHRLNRHLSDVAGIDPKIHGGTVRGAIRAVLDSLENPRGNPSTSEVMKVYRAMKQGLRELKARHGNGDLFNHRIYEELIALGAAAAANLSSN